MPKTKLNQVTVCLTEAEQALVRRPTGSGVNASKSFGRIVAQVTTPKTTEELIALLDDQHKEITALHKTGGEKLNQVTARLTSLEQEVARRPAGGGMNASKSLGHIVAQSDQYKNFIGEMGKRGTVRIKIEAALTSAPESGGAMVAPDVQREIIMLPRQRLTVRDLLAQGRTGSNLVIFTKQTGRTNSARAVSEGGEKPESSIVFAPAEAPVRTIATWIPVSRQIMDDVSQLQSTIDAELRYMIGSAEEDQLLSGDGVGENIFGLSGQVTQYSAPFTVQDENMLDTLLLGVAQAQQSKVQSTGIIVNDIDWMKMQTIKDGEGRYVGGGPFGSVSSKAWTLPVVATPAMDEGSFMVGAFAVAAQLFDRMLTEVLISSEDRDNFIKNMLTVRAEERVALAVKIPEAIVIGQYPNASV